MKNNTFVNTNSYKYLYNKERKEFYLIGLANKKLSQEETKFNLNSQDMYKQNFDIKNDCLSGLIEYGLLEDKNFKPNLKWVDTSEEELKKEILNLSAITFEVTDDCNLSCRYCANSDLYKHNENIGNWKLEFEKVQKLLNYLYPYFMETYEKIDETFERSIGFYGGEPLLQFELIKKTVNLLKTEKFKKFNFVYNMTTNGLLLNKYLDYLVENNFSILISLDGGKKENSLRVKKNLKESYQEVLNNIELIQNKYPKYFEEKVSFNSVYNINSDYSEIQKYFIKRFGKIAKISTISNDNINDSNLFNEIYSDPSESRIKYFNENRRELLNNSESSFTVFAEVFQEHFLAGQFVDVSEILNEGIFPKRVAHGCLPFSLKLFLTASGDIYMCEKVPRNLKMGNIDEEVNLDFNQAAKSFNLMQSRAKKICSVCYKNDNCGDCIMCLGIEKNSIKCNKFKSIKSYQDELIEQCKILELISTAEYEVNNA